MMIITDFRGAKKTLDREKNVPPAPFFYEIYRPKNKKIDSHV